MRRHIGRFSAALLLALVPAVLGTATAILYTDAGTTLLGRLASQILSGHFRGHFETSRVSGTFIGSLQLDDVVIRDSLDQPFATVDRILVAYTLPNLLAGRIIFNHAELDAPNVRVIKRANGRLNYQEIFRLGEGPPGGASPLVEVRDLRVRRGNVELRLPWNPPDTAQTPAQVAAALEADRARPGRVVLETPDGLRRVTELRALNARLPLLRISTPEHTPLTFDVDSLSTRVSDPAITIVDLAAHAWTHDDSLAFTVHRASLPNSRLSGGGVVTWPQGPVLYDFSLSAPRLDLRDLDWVSPDFPAMTGRAEITALSRSATLNAYTVRALDVQGPKGRIRGHVTALVDSHRGLGVEDMALDLSNLDLDVPRPYLDTVPLYGTLDGRLLGAGYKDGLDLDADLTFHDAMIEGGASSHLAGQGHLVLGGDEGTVFDTMVVSDGDIDLRTVHRITPSVELRGRLALAGVLRGPWHQVTYDGTLRHKDGELPETRAEGTATLDTRSETFRFSTRLNFDSLRFDGIRPSYPAIPVRGAVRGLIAAEGTVERFHVVASVQGDIGALALQGTIAHDSLTIRADSLTARFASLDLERLRGTGPHTLLTGTLAADGVLDTLAGPSGALAIDLSGGSAFELTLDTLHLRLRGESGDVVLDSLFAGWPAGQMTGHGRITWRGQSDQQVHLEFVADSLLPFEAILERYVGPPADTIVAKERLHGKVTGELELSGTAEDPRLLLRAQGEDLSWRGNRSPAVSVAFGWKQAERPEIGVGVRADSLAIGSWAVRDLNLLGGGYQDSLHWTGAASLSGMVAVSAGGEYWVPPDSVSVLSLDSVVAVLPRHEWRLRNRVTVVRREGRFDLSPIALEASDGSGSLNLSGTIPRTSPGNLTVSALGIDLNDVYAVLGLDTTGIAGTVQIDVDVGGTAAKPTLRGTGTVSDLAFGDLGSPFVQGVIDYADRRLDANLLLWKTGESVLRVEAQLPLDLALQSVPHRQVDGPLAVRIIADSTDLAVAEAFTRNLRKVRGTLRADVEVGGTWDQPRLGGTVEIRGGSANVPGLGVTYTAVNAKARLTGDSIAIDTLTMKSGEGSLRVTGGLRLDRLTRPILDLTLNAQRFRAIDSRRFLTLDASGTLHLTGPVWQAHLGGRMTADAGNLHFADLLTKRIVDLENPGDSGLIDLDLIRTEKLGANFQSRFLDSLSIDNLQVQMGESFWLRSSEANIQLDGNLTVNKIRDSYRYDGTLNAVRGNYALRLGGFVTVDFTVERGTVRYFGTPDLNAELDIEAKHVVTDIETNEDIPVIAKISGTLLQPKLELTSTPTPQRPGLSQTELVSYLMFRRPTFSLQGQGGQGSQYAAVQAGLSYLSSALSSELQRTLISDLGVPIDFIDIRTGGAGTSGLSGASGSAQVAQVAAGWQIGRRWFVTVVADLCTNAQRFYPSAEFRISRALRLKASVEPSYSCQAAIINPALSTNKYQVGLDVLWEREY
jgi:autotransporter translocation and assembly factor TamB